MLADERLSAKRLDEIDQEVAAVIDDAVKFADESPEPSLEELGKFVYAEPPPQR